MDALEIVVMPRDQLEQIYYVLRVYAYNKGTQVLITDLGDILGVKKNDVYCA